MKHESEKPMLPVPAPAPGLPEHPVFPTDAENEAYWRGVSSGLQMALASSVTIVGASPDDTPPGPRVRRARVDGLSGVKQAVFLESIAEGLTVEEAAARARISVSAIYAFANRAAGRAFAIAWDAANHRKRRPLADRLTDRAIKGQTEVIRGEDGRLVGTRHRHDNRLAMGMLTRADKKAEAWREGERLTVAISEEFEELLDIIEVEGDAIAFIESRRPREEEPYPPAGRAPEGDEALRDFYYRQRSPAEADRLPDRPLDHYPDDGRERGPDDDAPP